MINIQKTTSSLILLAIFLLVIGITAIDHNLRKPNAAKIISASVMGAEYLGDNGVVFQTNRKNCGAAVIKMIFDHYAINMSFNEIEAQLEFTEKGTSMLDIKKCAERNMLKAAGWRLMYERLERQRFPLILFVRDDHFIVVDSLIKNEIFIRDPAVGALKIGKDNLLKIWKGETLVITAR